MTTDTERHERTGSLKEQMESLLMGEWMTIDRESIFRLIDQHEAQTRAKMKDPFRLTKLRLEEQENIYVAEESKFRAIGGRAHNADVEAGKRIGIRKAIAIISKLEAEAVSPDDREQGA